MINRGRVVGLSLLLFLSITAVLYCQSTYRETLTAYQTQINNMAQKLEIHLNGRIQVLEILAVNREVVSLKPELFMSEFQAVAPTQGFTTMALFAPNGEFLFSLNQRRPKQAADPESLKAVLGGWPAITGAITYPGMEDPFISVRVPVWDRAGKVSAVLAAGIPIRELERVIRYDRQSKLRTLFLLDGNGELILYSTGPVALDRQAATAGFFRNLLDRSDGAPVAGRTPDGDRLQCFSVAIGQTDWRLGMVVPLAEIYQAFFRESAAGLLAFFIAACLTGLYHFDLKRVTRHRQELELQRLERLTVVSQLAATIAHEIRNPLTAIRGFVQLISRRSGKKVPQAYIDIIQEEIDRVTRLVDDFRTLARPVEQAVTEPVDLKQNIGDVVRLLEGQAVEKSVLLKLESTASPQVLADAGRLKQVWINLIRNAIEAVGPGDKVTVTLADDEDWAIVKVADTGPGIAPEAIEKLGKAFYTTKKQGTGIGLNVSFAIVRELCGQILVSSYMGQGTVFTVYLPLYRVKDGTGDVSS